MGNQFLWTVITIYFSLGLIFLGLIAQFDKVTGPILFPIGMAGFGIWVIIFFLGITLYASILVSNNTVFILRILSNPFSVAPSVLMAFVLFRLRRSKPALYGSIEIMVGVAVIVFSVRTSTTDLIAKIVAILGGVYIIVRGLDNIDRRLPEFFRPVWKKAFPDKSEV